MNRSVIHDIISFVFEFWHMIIVASILSYGIIGTSTRVEEIKRLAPASIKERGWEIVRYEGYQYGSFSTHGGKVWYHVREKDNHAKQYRVYIVLWGGELHYYYGEPESMTVIDHKTK